MSNIELDKAARRLAILNPIDYQPPTQPVAPPVAPAVANPPPAPPTLSARERWRQDIDRLGRSTSLVDQGRARQLVLQGEPPEPAPAAPPATPSPATK